ncbi:TPR repeat-containing protein [Scytonema sp. HK-05]|uniref:tetratricopeptide repeat protein n=1 Tax=Scytonema sp. HK-05 TaxID=1137095 RepID=UPI000937DAAF|nr:tetratricopeptide repeat protein [Scytonema sp. HK-05]OKH60714.1 hypothetical protein NIES2130_01070 [Scytonema sp. HK-05]BAY45001.1 TPR repeat-containing protein [Scytonema sp. HK-05]
MNLISELKLAFVKPLSCLTLCLLTTTVTSPLVLAETSYPQQPQRVAQLGDREQLERSRLIQEANVLYSQGNFTGAEENLRKLIKKFPKDAFGYYQLGNVLYQQGKAEEAITQYKEAIRLNSRYALAHNGMGIALASQGRLQEAIAEYQKALKINPEYADALASLGQALWQQGNRDQALASLEKAANIFKAQNRPDKANRVEQLLQQLKANDDPSVS